MMPREITFPALLQHFFQRRLLTERGASSHTIASYRDSSSCCSAMPSSVPDARRRH